MAILHLLKDFNTRLSASISLSTIANLSLFVPSSSPPPPPHHPYNHPQQQTSFTTILISSGHIKSFGRIKDYIVRIWHWLSKNVIGFEIEGLFWDFIVVYWRFIYSQAGTLWTWNWKCIFYQFYIALLFVLILWSHCIFVLNM